MTDINQKVKKLGELSFIIEKLRLEGKKIALSHGTYDLLHSGHIYHLQEGKKQGDVLVVSITPDRFIKKGEGRPRFRQEERLKFLAALECVDFVCVNNSPDAMDTLKILQPDIYLKGKDVERKADDPKENLYKEIKFINSYNGQVSFIESLPIHSTDLLNEFFTDKNNKYTGNLNPKIKTLSKVLPDNILSFLGQFKEKHNVADIILKIEQLSGMKTLVIGETIIDEYRFMSPLLGKSDKACVIAARYLKKEEHAGGVAALANHVAGICKNVTLLTYLGKSKPREGFIRKSLHSNIQPVFCYSLNQPTIVKRRFVDESNYAKIFEEYEFSQEFLPPREEERVKKYLEKNLGKYDLVIVIDYGHGFFSKKLIDVIVSNAKFLALNVQTNSGNVGFNYITKYPRADYVCLDELEARLAAHDEISDIEQILKNSLYMKLKPKKMVVTLGRRGSLAYEKESGLVRTPAIPTNVTDPIGAGDAFLAISAPCAAAGFPLDLTAFIGGVASSVAVGILGNKTSVKRDDLFRIISSFLS